MKKAIVSAVTFAFILSAVPAFAEKQGADAQRHAHRQAMKDIKKAQRENKVKEAGTEKKPGFWQREAERSGMAENGRRISGLFSGDGRPRNFFKDQDEKYKARKAAAAAQTVK